LTDFLKEIRIIDRKDKDNFYGKEEKQKEIRLLRLKLKIEREAVGNQESLPDFLSGSIEG